MTATTYSATIGAAMARQRETIRDVFISAAQDVAENVSRGGAYSPGTPVGVGFAWNNWDASLTGGPTAVIDAPTGLKEGDVTSGTTDGMALVIASADLGDTITIANPVRYVALLESGTPSPIPTKPKSDKTWYSQWIAHTAHQWPIIVRLAAARVRQAMGG